MHMIHGYFWLLFYVIALVCPLAIAVAAYERSRSRNPFSRAFDDLQTKAFGGMYLFAIAGRAFMPETVLVKLPWAMIVPGIDISLLIAAVACAGLALARAFRDDWSWRIGLSTCWPLLYVAICFAALFMDIECLYSVGWVWVPGALIGVLLTPFFTRALFVATEKPEELRAANRQRH